MGYAEKKIERHQNLYHFEMGREVNGVLVPVLSCTRESPTHILATKAIQIEYPDLQVISISQSWFPIGRCARCGCTIFSGDYHKNKIEQRKGKNRCLDCN